MCCLVVSFGLQRIIVSLCLTASSAMMMQDGGLISEIGNFFGEALRGLTDDDRESAAEAEMRAFPVEQQQKLTPSESDRKEYGERIFALSGSLQVWVTQICELDEAQQQQLSELVVKRVSDINDRYAKKSDPERQNRPFGATTPLLFVQPDGDGTKFTSSLLKLIRSDLLNDGQKEKLDAAVSERSDFQRAAFREYIVSIFDQELFLTTEQRNGMLEHFAATPDRITSPFYTFTAQPYYLPYKSLGEILRANKATFLDDRQRARLSDLTSGTTNGNQNYIMFQSSEGPEQWAENVKQATVAQRDIYLRAAAVRIGYLERSLDLTPEQVAYLTVASKGATTEALESWKESTQQTLDRMQQQMAQIQGNFSFSAQNITTDGLDVNAIWTHAIKKVNADKQSGDRITAIRNAKAIAVTAMLDQELWLLPNQRAEVREFSAASLPRNPSAKSSYDDYVRDLIVLAYPLHKGAEPRIKTVLSEPQQAVWKGLKEFIRWNKARNYLEIPMKNQGGSFTVPLAD